MIKTTSWPETSRTLYEPAKVAARCPRCNAKFAENLSVGSVVEFRCARGHAPISFLVERLPTLDMSVRIL